MQIMIKVDRGDVPTATEKIETEGGQKRPKEFKQHTEGVFKCDQA